MDLKSFDLSPTENFGIVSVLYIFRPLVPFSMSFVPKKRGTNLSVRLVGSIEIGFELASALKEVVGCCSA